MSISWWMDKCDICIQGNISAIENEVLILIHITSYMNLENIVYLLSSNSSILRHSRDRMNAQTCFGYSLASQTQKSQLQGGCRPVVLRIPFIKEQMYSYKSCGRWGLSRIAQSPSAVYFWSKGKIIMPPSIAVLVKYYIWSRPNCPVFLWVLVCLFKLVL